MNNLNKQTRNEVRKLTSPDQQNPNASEGALANIK